MPIPIVMPRLGMTMTEGRVVEWPFDPGTPVDQGEVVLIIESDKSEVEVEASGGGTFAEIFIEADEEVPCGTLLGVITEESDAEFDAAEFRATWERENPVEEFSGEDDGAAEASPAASTTEATASPRTRRIAVTPAARKRARELGIPHEQILGTGPGGRIRRRDVESAAARRENLRAVAEDVRLEVLSEGSGPEVALLPGFGTDISAFAGQLPALADGYRVHGVNPRGIGLSDAPEADAYTVGQAADDLAALLEGPTHLLGTSLGTAVAIETALRHPGKVSSLALLAPVLEVRPRLVEVSRSWCSLAATGNPEILAESLLPWFFGPGTLSDEKARARIARGLPATLRSASAETLQRTRAGMLAWSGTRSDSLGQIDVPTLVVYGEHDLLAPDGAAIAAAIPGAKALALRDAGHAIGIEASEAINAALLEHLAAAAA